MKQNFFKRVLPTKLSVLFGVLMLLIGLVVGLNLRVFPKIKSSQEFRQSGDYRFTSPLLDCEIDQDIGTGEYKPSRIDVMDIISNNTNNGKINYAAVYFRDLNNGPWFGINEKELFAPASLLKLPTMIGIFKYIESNPSFATKEILFEKKLFEEQVIQNFAPEKELVLGQKYTVSDLIYRMIVYSDNQAYYLLSQNIDLNEVGKVFQDLGIEYISGTGYPDSISVKSYATFFRVLFNSSYLNRADSEKALEMLSEVKFDGGISQGIPSTILIAHKFGEREISGQLNQLHDCGIVYYPKHPFILCVMTRGQNWDDLSSTIGEISKEIYTDINQKYGGK